MGTLKVEVELIADKYFYTTEERLKRCPLCKREYQSRELCLNCSKNGSGKVKTLLHIKQHVGMIKEDFSLYQCSCKFSSFSGWSQFWRKGRPDSICKHARRVCKEIKSSKLPRLSK